MTMRRSWTAAVPLAALTLAGTLCTSAFGQGAEVAGAAGTTTSKPMPSFTSVTQAMLTGAGFTRVRVEPIGVRFRFADVGEYLAIVRGIVVRATSIGTIRKCDTRVTTRRFCPLRARARSTEPGLSLRCETSTCPRTRSCCMPTTAAR